MHRVPRWLGRGIAAAIALLVPLRVAAVGTVNEASLEDVRALYGAGAVVQDFEGLTGAATSALQTDVPIAAAHRLSKPGSGLPDVQSIAGLHFHSGGGAFGGDPGTPVAVLELEGALAGTASSGANVLAPLQVGTELSCLAPGCILDLFFEEPVLDVALWSSSPVSIYGQTHGGDVLDLATATGDGGGFVGLRRDVPEIERLVVIGINPQGFVIDDLVYALPEPSTPGLVALGCLALVARRARWRRAGSHGDGERAPPGVPSSVRWEASAATQRSPEMADPTRRPCRRSGASGARTAAMSRRSHCARPAPGRASADR